MIHTVKIAKFRTFNFQLPMLNFERKNWLLVGLNYRTAFIQCYPMHSKLHPVHSNYHPVHSKHHPTIIQLTSNCIQFKPLI